MNWLSIQLEAFKLISIIKFFCQYQYVLLYRNMYFSSEMRKKKKHKKDRMVFNYDSNLISVWVIIFVLFFIDIYSFLHAFDCLKGKNSEILESMCIMNKVPLKINRTHTLRRNLKQKQREFLQFFYPIKSEGSSLILSILHMPIERFMYEAKIR